MERLSQWFYRVASVLYPRELRLEFGVDMERAFRDSVRHAARSGGGRAVLRLWPRTLLDVLRSSAAYRRDRRATVSTPSPDHSFRPPAPRETIMDNLFADIRHGVRNLWNSPGFAVAATLTLALGVGASVTMFSGLSNFILEPLPFDDQGDLQMVWSVIPERGDAEVNLSYLDFLDLRDSGSLEQMAAWYTDGRNLTGGDAPSRIQIVRTSAALFQMLGIEPARGRVFNEGEEAAAEPVVILSHGLFERQFGADPAIVGSTVQLDGSPHQVIGVMPADFWYPTPQYEAWLPLDLSASTAPRNARFLGGLGKLTPGTDARGAEAALSATAAALAREYPGTNGGFEAISLTPLVTEVVGDEMRYSLYSLNVTGVAVLLIACVNIANLLIARGLVRRRELAVRAALGARRLRLVRQALAENLVLGVTGGALGAVIAWFGIAGIATALSANEPGRVPRLEEYLQSGFDAQVALFTVGVSLAAVLLFGLVPALHATRGDLHAGLQDGARGMGSGAAGGKLQKSLVVVELALTVGLLIGAGLALRSYAVVQQVDPGMQRDGLLTMAVALPTNDYTEEHRVLSLYDDVLAAFAATPGVSGAAATSSLPAARQGAFRSFEVEGRAIDRAADYPRANRVAVSPEYFDVLGTPLIQGRWLAASDDADAAPAALINQSAARFYWPEADPIGERVRVADSGDEWVEIVGVVGDLKNNGLHRPTWPALYVPLAQAPRRQMNFVVRTDGDPTAATGALRGALASIDDTLPVYRVMSMERVYANRFWGETLTMKLLAWCAGGALVLALVGIYGVISFAVTRRTHEMGVRIALGARSGNVISLVVGQGLWLVAMGVGLGLLLGFGLSQGLSFMLFGVDSGDPTTYIAVVAFVISAAMLASYLPARRATRVDPIVALRDD